MNSPFASVVVASDTEHGGTHGAEEKGEGDGGRNVRLGYAVKVGQVCQGQADRMEIVAIHSLQSEAKEESKPGSCWVSHRPS